MAKKQQRKSNLEEIQSKLVEHKVEVKDGVFIFTGPITIAELSNSLGKSTNEIVSYFFKKGQMYNQNYTLNEEEIAELCIEFGLDFQKEQNINAANFMEQIEIIDSEEDLETRAPIITVMGHVDHGKTTLLDKIRKANVASSEAGGITQHTGAYQIKHKNKKITFLDTPGHQAFTGMRIRGAKVTDIVILVVAADDGIMPQTEEAISHAKNANVPIIVFINKMDKVNKDIERIKAELSNHDIVTEEWNGNTQFIYGSALSGKGIDELFDAINVQSEILELKANKNRYPIGTVIESKLDKGRGSVATLIVQNGTLHARDFIVAGSQYGKIRTLETTSGKKIEKAGPGTPVVITGLNYTPLSGDKFYGFHEEKAAKKLASDKSFLDKQQNLKQKNMINNLDESIKVINIIVKSDVFGTSEAIKSSLEDLKNDEVVINVIHSGSGEITKSDILLAKASKAIIYGFNIKVNDKTINEAAEEGVEIKNYSIIYKIIEEVQLMAKGLKAPKYLRQEIGQAQILKLFWYSKIGQIAGCLAISGKIKANAIIQIYRKNKMIHEGKLETLKSGLNDAKEIGNGKEFGCKIYKYEDAQIDDIIKAYEEILVEE